MEGEKPKMDTLEGRMWAVDLELKEIKDKSILIVGDGKVGKSTIL